MLQDKYRYLILALSFVGYGEAFAAVSKEMAPPNLPLNQPRHVQDADKPIVVLAVDGGGVRGIIPAVLIAGIEKQLGKPITEVVDLFAGTSAGSIVVGFLNIPDENGKQRYSAAEGVSLSGNAITKVFKNSALRTIRTLGGLAGSKYSAKPLEAFLEQYVGNMKMSETVKPVLITSVDLATKNIFNFSTRFAKEWPSMFNLPLKLAVRSSTAAPIYFKPLDLTLASGAKLVLTDGGLVAMSPELLALAEARALYPNRRYIVISLSTGRYPGKESIAAKGMSAGSAPKMLMPLISATLETQLKLSNMLMENEQKKGDVEYYRVDVSVTKTGSSLDDASAKNLQYLQQVGAQAVASSPAFSKMVKRLSELESEKATKAPSNPYQVVPMQNSVNSKISGGYTQGQTPKIVQQQRQTGRNTYSEVPMQPRRHTYAGG